MFSTVKETYTKITQFFQPSMMLPSHFKNIMSLLQPTSNSVELCRNYEYVMYILSVKFKR